MQELIEVHQRLLERWRKSMNLVGPGDVGFHYADCRQALHWLDPTGHWVDLGSGAGFPGIVLASMAPQLELDLVDSRKKRCVFLEQVVHEAGVEARVRVRCQRVETLTGPYDGVVARAFASPQTVLDHAARLLRPDAVVVLFLQADGAVPEDPRFEVFHVEHYAVQGKSRKAVGCRKCPSPRQSG